MKAEKGIYKIRPSGRHILTIGRELIHDQYAAILELVKNAYDADSPDVAIMFVGTEKRNSIKIVIEDKGHGMSRDVVINNWLVPSTDDKLKRVTSPKGRIMQGRKGVGRYAASFLGNDLLLETVTQEGEKTEVIVEWSDFQNADFLDDVEILVSTNLTQETQGTRLTITGDSVFLKEWSPDNINNLEFELKKIISPIGDVSADLIKSDFVIKLVFDGFFEDPIKNKEKVVEPFPLFNLYDYKICGSIDNNGKGTLKYSSQKAKNILDEDIIFDFGQPTDCGKIYLDIRVYDREADAIEQLIQRGLKTDHGDFVGKLEARRLLNIYNGIGVYRNGFRIRPLGNSDFDWLKLNEQRIQNPSMRVGSNQVIGYVQIQSEELSGLEEKSARDGLKENNAFDNLKNLAKVALNELEERRYIFRSKAGLSRRTLKLERELESILSFENLEKDISKQLRKIGVDKNTTKEILKIISRKAEEQNQIAENIRQAVAIYQGQATLGKIIEVILHEGRKPLGFFKDTLPSLKYYSELLEKTRDPEIINEILPISFGFCENAEIFVLLFSKLDPLATRKRKTKEDFLLLKTIAKAFLVFERELEDKQIKYNISGDKHFSFNGWPQDFYVIMTNLIDNSMFWMIEKNSKDKTINIHISTKDGHLEYIDYKDSGPGIEKQLIESGVIFEPEFSTKIYNDKTRGTGLGLAIAGEAATRNALILQAYESESGAYFRLQPITEEPQ